LSRATEDRRQGAPPPGLGGWARHTARRALHSRSRRSANPAPMTKPCPSSQLLRELLAQLEQGIDQLIRRRLERRPQEVVSDLPRHLPGFLLPPEFLVLRLILGSPFGDRPQGTVLIGAHPLIPITRPPADHDGTPCDPRDRGPVRAGRRRVAVI